MKRISEEEFIALNEKEQSEYLKEFIEHFTDEQKDELFKRMVTEGILEGYNK